MSFAAVSLNWQRLPEWFRPWLPIGGFAVMAAGLAILAEVVRSGGMGGFWLYFALALIGMSMASAFLSRDSSWGSSPFLRYGVSFYA